MADDIFDNVVVFQDGDTVMYNLKGNRNDDDRKQLTKVYSIHDSDILKEAVQKLREFYDSLPKEE